MFSLNKQRSKIAKKPPQKNNFDNVESFGGGLDIIWMSLWQMSHHDKTFITKNDKQYNKFSHVVEVSSWTEKSLLH